ncbi:hypothetical protein N7505_001767 [Penicillium chrysogenum]|uniref:Helicase-associated domain-containing protein n=1 Tax=Penicillium chrysogenum TaxID=5076 RepID=A0ABQ8WY36_PENCH|nr:hypothetical protein N7505_001767 [Penicillium chrysogenum]
MKKVCLFAQNEACFSTRRGVQLRLLQFSRRNIHTICSTTMPIRSSRKLRLLDPIIAGNQSALERHRPTMGAHYYTTRPPLLEALINQIVAKQNPADELPHDSQLARHSLSKNGHILGGEHGELKKSQAVSLENRVLAQLREDRSRSPNCEGDELSREAFREHGSRTSLALLENPLKSDMLSAQQSTSDQIPTVHHLIKGGLLSTINENARKVLENANRNMPLAEDFKRRYDELQSLMIPLDDPKYVARRTAKLPLFKHEADTCHGPGFQELTSKKLELPVRHFAKQILDVINSNTYSIIDWKRGSGKTTQDAIDNSTGVSCKVLCVHLKELEAVEVPIRVADERFEEPGDTTCSGLPDHIAPLGGSVTYCSRDALLRMLKNESSSLEQFSHVIFDDVHLRGFDLGPGMLLLKRFVERRKSTSASVPKVILMGSFAQIDSLCSYFGTESTDGTLLPAPHVTIPMGFPVEKYYLEEVIGNIAHALTPSIIRPLLLDDSNTRIFLNEHFKLFEKSEEVEINIASQRFLPRGLISATLLSLLSTTKTGSILVFVPENASIPTVIEQIKTFGPKLGIHFADKNRFRIIQLHKNTAKEEAKVNLGIPPGCRRLIIAKEESNFTIPDVKYVVDCGKSSLREYRNQKRSHDLERIRSTVGWSSQKVALQRAECAGRAQAGEYYFLGSKKCFDSLSPTISPRTWSGRSGLRQACLHVKRATSGTSPSIAELFAQTYKPPQESSVRAAVDDLKKLQVLDEEEELTALGHLVADLDMDPCFGKMVVLGIIFRCLDPMLILAGLGWNGLLLPRGLTGQFNFGHEADYPVATIQTFRAIRGMLHEGKLSAFTDEVSKDNISKLYHTVTPEIERIIKTLIAARLLPADSSYGDRGFYSATSNFNASSLDNALIRALLVQCLSSNLTVKSRKTVKKGKGLIESRDEGFIMVSNFEWPRGMETTTRVSPLAACLFGNKIEQEEDGVILDSWVKIKLQTVDGTENEVAKSLVQTHRVLNESLQTVFKILPCEERAGCNTRGNGQAYIAARNRLLKTIRKTLHAILHSGHPPLGIRKGI